MRACHGTGYIHHGLCWKSIIEYLGLPGWRSSLEAFMDGMDFCVDRVGSPAEHLGSILVVARIDFPLESRYRPPSYEGGGRSSGHSWRSY